MALADLPRVLGPHASDASAWAATRESYASLVAQRDDCGESNLDIRVRERAPESPQCLGRDLRTTQQFGRGNPQPGVQIVGGQSGRCVDVPNASTTNGTQVQLWDCGNSTAQRWTHTANRQLQVYGNKCLDAYGAGTSNGTQVIIWDCHGGTNQQWNVNSNGTITSAQSGLCLDANGNAAANGTRLILWSCHGGTNQQWNLRS